MMKKYLLICIFLLLIFNVFSLDKPGSFNFNFSYTKIDTLNLSDTSSDTNTKTKQKEIAKSQNPFNDLKLDWLNDKYRMDRTFFAVGIVTLSVGLPMMMVGLFEYIFPQSDKSSVSDTTFICLMGVGSGLMLTGSTFTIVGAVRLNYLKSKEKIEVSFNFGL
jgi:hypothetical protein